MNPYVFEGRDILDVDEGSEDKAMGVSKQPAAISSFSDRGHQIAQSSYQPVRCVICTRPRWPFLLVPEAALAQPFMYKTHLVRLR